MSLALLSNATAMAPNGLTLPFIGTGGTAPYSYAILLGGAGGTINSSGLYTSPYNTTGIDTIQVTDSLGATATREILIASPIELVCDIIQNEMGLSQGRVFLYNQKIFQPVDQGLFIAVGIVHCKPFGNTRSYSSTSGLDQLQSVNMQALINIEIISRSTDALERKEEVIMALKSLYAQQQQELNSFYIAPITTGFQNLSFLDASSIPYRFSISTMINYMMTKQSAVPYYSSFSTAGVFTG